MGAGMEVGMVGEAEKAMEGGDGMKDEALEKDLRMEVSVRKMCKVMVKAMEEGLETASKVTQVEWLLAAIATIARKRATLGKLAPFVQVVGFHTS